MARVELAPGASTNDLATSVAATLARRLEEDPARSRLLERLGGRVALIDDEDGRGLTVHFERGRAVIHDGVVGIPDLTLRGARDVIADPAPRAGGLLTALRAGRLRIYGLPTGLPLLARLGRLLRSRG